MLDRRLSAFSGSDGLGDLLLGMLSYVDRVTVLAAVPRAGGGAAAHGALAEFFLGVIAVGRTLHATVAFDASSSSPASHDAPPEAPVAPAGSLLR